MLIHCSRFFTARKPEQNPNSGTVVDDVVTLPERYDFFLVSQSVREVISMLSYISLILSSISQTILPLSSPSFFSISLYMGRYFSLPVLNFFPQCSGLFA